MVSFNVYRSTYSGAYVEGICLATDEKPVVGIANGSILYVVDTSTGETTRYMYDQESMSWIEAECPCAGGGSGGSGGGGGSAEPLIVLYDGENFVITSSYNEIEAAVEAGKTVWLKEEGSPRPGQVVNIWYALVGLTPPVPGQNMYKANFTQGGTSYRSFRSEDPDQPMGEIRPYQ